MKVSLSSGRGRVAFRVGCSANAPPSQRSLLRERRRRMGLLVRAAENEVDFEAEVEEFMKKQAEIESGATSVARLDQAVGIEAVPDELAKQYCSDIVKVIKDLDTYRDMSFGEVKLTVAIDPKSRDRPQIGSENEDDVSREELVNALDEVSKGVIPNDRVALKVLWEEMSQWPGLEADREKKAPKKDDSKKAGWREGQARPPVGRESGEKPSSLEDLLPDWVGYSYLYLLSSVPVIIVVVVIAILFVNSLQ